MCAAQHAELFGWTFCSARIWLNQQTHLLKDVCLEKRQFRPIWNQT